MITKRIVIESPLDMHVHFRQGEMLQNVVPHTSETFAGALAMPNTDPIITTIEQIIDYKKTIQENSTFFKPYVALYFQTSYTKKFLEEAKDHCLSIKFYPKGLTTNSHHGCDPDDPKVYDVLEIMEDLSIPLNIHPEAPGYHEDRERLFGKYILDWTRRFPNLKIILEHMSDRQSVRFLEFPNVYATMTPQHLMLNGDDLMGPPLKPHFYCMPVLKRPEDMGALLGACMYKHPKKIMAGTDSAPHTESNKLNCGCAGCFTAPIALQLYTEIFDKFDCLGLLQDFLSNNARRVYGVEPLVKSVQLIDKPHTVSDKFGDVVPLFAGQQIKWSIGGIQ